MLIVINTILLMKEIFEISICLSPSLWNNLKYIMDMTFSNIHFLQNLNCKRHTTKPTQKKSYILNMYNTHSF